MDRKEARSPFVLTLYSYHPLDSRRISSDTTEHLDTRARLNLIKPDKFSNSGRAASILIRAMNINSRRWLTWRDTFDHILEHSPRFFFFSPPTKNRTFPRQRPRFVSFLTRGFPFFARRMKIGSKLYFFTPFISLSLSLPPFLSLPLSNSLIFDRISFESRLSPRSLPVIESVRHADSIRSNRSHRSQAKSLDAEGGMCRATISINKARGYIESSLLPPHPTLLMKFPAMFTKRGRRIDDDGN